VKGRLFLSGFLLLVLFFSGCVDRDIKVVPEAPANSINIYVDEDPEDINNLNQVHIANLSVYEGKLELIVVEDHEEIGRLRTVIFEIQAKETLPLTIERMKDDGTLVMGDIQVTPEEPGYIYAVQEELLQYGFLGEVR
jgi:hypothetical protein